jgi:hypothetical protein
MASERRLKPPDDFGFGAALRTGTVRAPTKVSPASRRLIGTIFLDKINLRIYKFAALGVC